MTTLNFRTEIDTLGEVKVPSDKYYGAQTQRSIENFPICRDDSRHKISKELLYGMILVKKAAAITHKELKIADPNNLELTKITPEIADMIIFATDIIFEKFDWFYENEFPLITWQTNTQVNMNVNEVIASVANEKVTGKKGGKSPVHPNDHVNLGQSSNDTFPTAMNVATILLTYKKFLPTLLKFNNALAKKEKEFANIIKIGRTHTQDAIPIKLGQEFGGYRNQITTAFGNICRALVNVHVVPQGGTAIGTGLNCHPKFAEIFTKHLTEISKFSELKNIVSKLIMNTESGSSEVSTNSIFQQTCGSCDGFSSPKNNARFMALASSDELIEFHGSLNTLACSITKIANDIRFLASGPRSGFGEIILPENEPGSSIMPGKVNPTQCESLTMILCQVIGNNVAVTTGCMQGHFELNVFRPMIIKNIIESLNILNDGINSFVDNCLNGITANEKKIKQLLDQSLMLVTALNPHIGYDNAAKIAKFAHKENTTLKEAATKLQIVTSEQFDAWVKPEEMV